MLVDDAFELYLRLKSLALIQESPPFWWPQYGSFEVVLGVMLTQNSRWHRVEISLDNLRQYQLLSLESIATCERTLLCELIRPSGMHHKKAICIQALTGNMLDDFGNFEYFCEQVSRGWLLEQRGIGPESADAMLCYACKRAEMVVDRYTQRLLHALGYEFESYDELKRWCEQLHVNFEERDLPQVYAEFHGMIVEYMKRYSSRSRVKIIWQPSASLRQNFF